MADLCVLPIETLVPISETQWVPIDIAADMTGLCHEDLYGTIGSFTHIQIFDLDDALERIESCK